jgi:hypothetical protein
MPKLVRSRPRTHFAQCHRDDVAHINRKAVNFLSAAAIFWIEKLQFQIPAITIKPTEGAFSTVMLSSCMPVATASAKVEAAWKALVAAKFSARPCEVVPKFRKS